MLLTRPLDGSTTIFVAVAEQAQLHGVLAGVRDIGAVLTDVRATGPADAVPGYPHTATDECGR